MKCSFPLSEMFLHCKVLRNLTNRINAVKNLDSSPGSATALYTFQGPGGGGGTLIFSLRGFGSFFGLKILNCNIFGVFFKK